MTEQLKLATQVANKLGLPPTWPNLRTIEIALIFEHADRNRESLGEAAEIIVECARQFYALPSHRLKKLRLERYWPLNRFWFEDGIWQMFLPPKTEGVA
jgi:hypothetical protein